MRRQFLAYFLVEIPCPDLRSWEQDYSFSAPAARSAEEQCIAQAILVGKSAIS
jgi:hypothetical protein